MFELVVRAPLFVNETAQEAHREALALRNALVRHYCLQTRLQQLLSHLRLELLQVCHRRLVLRGHCEVWRKDEVEGAGLASQTEVERDLVWLWFLKLLELVNVFIRKILLKWASNVIWLLSILLTVIDRSFSPTVIASGLSLARH